MRDGDVVLVRDGYHPVVAGRGYNVYYLNCLAGSARQLATPRIRSRLGAFYVESSRPASPHSAGARCLIVIGEIT